MKKAQAEALLPRRRFSLRALLQHQQQAIKTSFQRMVTSPLTTLMTICVLGIALVLPTGFAVLLHNAHEVTHAWETGSQVSLYLQRDLNARQITELVQQIRLRDDVIDVKYISPEKGLELFQDASGFSDVLSQLPENPLPPVIEVYPTQDLNSAQALNVFLVSLRQLPHVAAAQLDMQWLQRLFAIIKLMQKGAYGLMFLFCVAVLLIIGNTIRLATQNHQAEMMVMRLIGATDAMVRRPFLYTGFAYGFLGGLIAWLLIFLARCWLSQPFYHLMQLYHSESHLLGLSLGEGMVLLLTSSGLGVVGACLAVRRHRDDPFLV